MKPCLAALIGWLGLAPLVAWGETTTVTGGADLRTQVGGEDFAGVEGLFLNLRQVFTQGGADRWIVVVQGDSGENVEHPRLYQTYAQLKGPLGRWNVRAGRYIVPFGLLASYDSERLVLKTMEPLSVGLKLDNGVQVSGFTTDFVYAISVTEGGAAHRPVAIGRLGQERGDLSWGVSVLAGELPETASKETVEIPNAVLPGVPFVDKRRVVFDATLTAGPDLWRAEAVAGTDNGDVVGGAYAEYERALSANWSIGANLGAWDGAETRWRVGAVVARRLGPTAAIRAGYVNEHETAGRERTFVAQLYWEFSRAL